MSQYITIPGFEDLTPQQIVDMAEEHVRRTGRKSVNESRICLYGGIGCAASVFIRSECREDVEWRNWPQLVIRGLVPSCNEHIVSACQAAHDIADSDNFLPEFTERMTRVREKYGLAPYTPKAG